MNVIPLQMKVKVEGSADYRSSPLEHCIEQNLRSEGIVLAPPDSIDTTKSFYDEPFIRRKAVRANTELTYERWFNDDATEEFADSTGAWITIPLEVFLARFNDHKKFREIVQFSQIHEGQTLVSGVTLYYASNGTLTDVDVSVGRGEYLAGILRHLGQRFTSQGGGEELIQRVLRIKTINEVIATLIDYHFKER